MGLREWTLLGLLSLLWGCSFLFIEVALRDLPVFTLALGRTGLGAAVLTGWLILRGISLRPIAEHWGGFVLLGALRGAMPICLIVWAQTRIESGLAGILNSTSPLFTMIVAHYLANERLTRRKLIGCVIGMSGVVLMIGVDALRGLGDSVVGQLAMIGATCCYGFAASYGKRFEGMPHALSAAGMLAGASALILPLSLVLENPWTLRPGAIPLAALLGLAILSTAIGFVVWFRLIQTAGPGNTSLVTFLIPLVALGLGVAVLGEQPTGTSLAGVAILFAGLTITQMKPAQENLSLRPATAVDSEFAYTTTRDTMRDYTLATWGKWSEEDVRRRTNENIAAGATSIILLGDTPIGIRVVEREADCIRLAQLYILPAYQRLGIGSRLIAQLLAEARAAGLPLRLRVLRVNPAFHLYRRLGFKVVDATPERYFMEHQD